MTSTNEGKDVKSNLNSGQRGKSYYIELYKSLDSRLSGECELRERTRHLCEAWCRVHSLCQHSAAATHPHLLSWLQRHTARTILQTEWQAPTSKNEQISLEAAIDAFIEDSQIATAERNGVSPPWESQLVQRGEWFKKVLLNPWGHPVLRALLDPKEPRPSDEEILEWLIGERGVMFVTRLRQLAASKCDDLAMSLVTSVMDRVRAAQEIVPDNEQGLETKEKPSPPGKESAFACILSSEAGFTVDVWELLTDIEFVLLHKGDRVSKCIELAKLTPLRNGYQLVERLQSRLATSPREKKLWKNVKEVATLIAQVIIARCMLIPVCASVCRTALYCCSRSLVRLVRASRLGAAAGTLAAPAATSRHLHTLASGVHAQCTPDMKPFVCELYVRAITAGMNELERLKLNSDKQSEARASEQTLASWFTQLGSLLSDSPRLQCECNLTAFSVHPSAVMFEKIRGAPILPPVAVDDHDAKEEPTSEFGSWATDSRTQTNLVKTSETLNMKQTQPQGNVLSTAILTEGDSLGLSPEVGQDLAVLLSGPRVKTLSWDMDRELLKKNCLLYMERTQSGTRAICTELKYLNLDPQSYLHLPEENDHEDDLYYGIEKGYEHLVEHEPEDIWNDAMFDMVTPESPGSSILESEIRARRRKSKKAHDSDEDCDPLSTVSDAKKAEKKKERPHSKDSSTKDKSKDRVQSKEKKKKDPNKEKSKERKKKEILTGEQKEKRKLAAEKKEIGHESEMKTERKPRKRKPKEPKVNPVVVPKPGSLTNLIGMKVANVQLPETKYKNKPETKFSVTDSDYDSQGKSSLASVNSEGQDSDVLIDGFFSMDDYRSPEKSESLLRGTSFPNNELSLARGKVAVNTANLPNKTRVQNMPQSVQRNPSHTVTKSSETESDVNEDVKRNITKLLEYRKQQRLLTPTMHRSQNAIHKQIIPEHTVISPKAVEIPDIPKVYINKKQIDQLNDLKNEVDIFLRTKFSKKPSVPSPETSQASLSLCNEQFLPNYQRNPSIGNKYSQQTSIGSTHSNSSPTVIQSPYHTKSSDTPSQRNFQNFLKELQHSTNAGTGSGTVKKNSIPVPNVTARKDIKPVSRVPPLVPSQVVEPLISPCAKLSQQGKQIENQLNTFSRLSYMHKNKQMLDAKSNEEQLLNRSIEDHGITKLKYLQAKGHVVISKSPLPKESINQKANIFIRKIKNKNIVSDHPILSNSLQSKLNPFPNKSCNDESVVKTSTVIKSKPLKKNSSLSENDQNDLLLLLRQQNKLNTPLTSKVVKTDININKIVNNPHFNNHKGKSLLKTSSSALPSESVIKKIPTGDRQEKYDSCKAMNLSYTSENVYQKTVDNKTFKASQSNVDVTKKEKTDFSSRTKSQDTTRKESVSSSPQDWEKVMDAILAHKTPSRGPNALDMALKKDNNLRNQRIVRPNVINVASQGKIKTVMGNPPQTPTIAPLVSQDKKSKPSRTYTENPEEYCEQSNTFTRQQIEAVQRELEKTLQTCFQKEFIKKTTKSLENSVLQCLPSEKKDNHQVLQRHLNRDVEQVSNELRNIVKKKPTITQEVLKKSLQVVQTKTAHSEPLEKQSTADLLKDVTSVTSGIPNSDYDLLEELMDDELRKEIGELSDEEDYNVAPTGNTTKQVTSIDKCNSVIKNNVTQNEKIKQINSLKNQNHNDINQTYVLNRNISKTDKYFKTEISCASSIKTTNAKTFPTTCELNAVAVNTSPSAAINPNTSTNISSNSHHITSGKKINVLENVILATVPKPHNIVLIESDLVYDPYRPLLPTVPSGVCNVNQPSYLTYNNVPNITVYQSTQFAAPAVNPVIIGSAMTMPTSGLCKSPTAKQVSPNIKESIEDQSKKVLDVRNKDTSIVNKIIPNCNPGDFLSKQCGNIFNGETLLAEDYNSALLDNNKSPAPTVKHVPLVVEEKRQCGMVNYHNEKIPENINEDILHQYVEDPHTDIEKEIMKDVNFNKRCERKVLSEVQETLKHTEVLNKNFNDKCNNILNELHSDRERLNNKRLLLLNRQTNYRSSNPPIPLTYSPLIDKSPPIISLPKEIDKPNIEIKQSHILNETIIDNREIKDKINSKENNGMSRLPSRLRSSSCINFSSTISEKDDQESKISALKIKEKRKEIKQITKKSVLINQAKQSKPSQKQITKHKHKIKVKSKTSKKSSKVLESSEQETFYSDSNKNNSVESAVAQIPSEILVQLNGDGDQSNNEALLALPSNIDIESQSQIFTQHDSTTSINYGTLHLNSEQSGLKNNNVLTRNQSKKKSSADNLKVHRKVEKSSNNEVTQHKEVSLQEKKNNIQRTYSSTPLLTEDSPKSSLNNKTKHINKGDVKFPSGPKNFDNNIMQKSNATKNSMNNSQKNIINNLLQSHEPHELKNCQNIEVFLDKKSNLPNSTHQDNIDDASSSIPKQCDDEMNILKKEITLEELPMSADGKKQVRIKLKNGKIFKASVYGEVHVSLETLFSNPSMKSALLGSLTETKKYTLNIKQVSTSDKNDPSKILETRIEEIKFLNKPDIDTVINLLSDEEETINSSKLFFKTEFGKYTISESCKVVLEKHQKKFDQKCLVVLNRIKKLQQPVATDIRKSNIKAQDKPERSNLRFEASDTYAVSKNLTTCELDVLPNENVIPSLEVHKNVTEIIEIDDSSNDSIESARKAANEEIGVGTDASLQKAFTKQADVLYSSYMKPPEEKIDELKCLLLKDLGVDVVENLKAPAELRNTNKNKKSNRRPVTKECYVKLTRCNSIDGMYKHMKEIDNNVTADQTKSNYLLDVNRTSMDENQCSEKNNELLEIGIDDDDVKSLQSSPMLSRSGSFSLLTDFPFSPEIIPDHVVSPRKSYEDGRNSPVMDVFETIAALNNGRFPKRDLECCIDKTEHAYLKCYSDWLKTKSELSTECKYDMLKPVKSLRAITMEKFKKQSLIDRYVMLKKLKCCPSTTNEKHLQIHAQGMKRKLENLEDVKITTKIFKPVFNEIITHENNNSEKYDMCTETLRTDNVVKAYVDPWLTRTVEPHTTIPKNYINIDEQRPKITIYDSCDTGSSVVDDTTKNNSTEIILNINGISKGNNSVKTLDNDNNTVTSINKKVRTLLNKGNANVISVTANDFKSCDDNKIVSQVNLKGTGTKNNEPVHLKINIEYKKGFSETVTKKEKRYTGNSKLHKDNLIFNIPKINKVDNNSIDVSDNNEIRNKILPVDKNIMHTVVNSFNKIKSELVSDGDRDLKISSSETNKRNAYRESRITVDSDETNENNFDIESPAGSNYGPFNSGGLVEEFETLNVGTKYENNNLIASNKVIVTNYTCNLSTNQDTLKDSAMENNTENKKNQVYDGSENNLKNNTFDYLNTIVRNDISGEVSNTNMNSMKLNLTNNKNHNSQSKCKLENPSHQIHKPLDGKVNYDNVGNVNFVTHQEVTEINKASIESAHNIDLVVTQTGDCIITDGDISVNKDIFSVTSNKEINDFIEKGSAIDHLCPIINDVKVNSGKINVQIVNNVESFKVTEINDSITDTLSTNNDIRMLANLGNKTSCEISAYNDTTQIVKNISEKSNISDNVTTIEMFDEVVDTFSDKKVCENDCVNNLSLTKQENNTTKNNNDCSNFNVQNSEEYINKTVYVKQTEDLEVLINKSDNDVAVQNDWSTLKGVNNVPNKNELIKSADYVQDNIKTHLHISERSSELIVNYEKSFVNNELPKQLTVTNDSKMINIITNSSHKLEIANETKSVVTDKVMGASKEQYNSLDPYSISQDVSKHEDLTPQVSDLCDNGSHKVKVDIINNDICNISTESILNQKCLIKYNAKALEETRDTPSFELIKNISLRTLEVVSRNEIKGAISNSISYIQDNCLTSSQNINENPEILSNSTTFKDGKTVVKNISLENFVENRNKNGQDIVSKVNRVSQPLCKASMNLSLNCVKKLSTLVKNMLIDETIQVGMNISATSDQIDDDEGLVKNAQLLPLESFPEGEDSINLLDAENNDELIVQSIYNNHLDHEYIATSKSTIIVNSNENLKKRTDTSSLKVESYGADDLNDDTLATESNTGNSILDLTENFNDPLRKEVTLLCKSDGNIFLKGIEYDDPIVGTRYVFPLEHAANSSIENDTYTEELTQDLNLPESLNEGYLDEKVTLKVKIPKFTYSRVAKNVYGLKRKRDMNDIKVVGKKYRKGKQIDYTRLMTHGNPAYCKEYKRVFDYCSSLKVSFSQPYHKENIDVEKLLTNWPNICSKHTEVQSYTDNNNTLFRDINFQFYKDPLDMPFVEELSVIYDESEQCADTNETNFNMGFGERSDRVIKNLKVAGDVSKFSAAILSDVKQPQPFLLSEHYKDENETKFHKCKNCSKDQVNKLTRYITSIQLRDKVRSFFKKTTIELKDNWIKEQEKDNFHNTKLSKNDITHHDSYLLDFIDPLPIEAVVQVVQVGQLPVSAAAQNPVTCDPRVTQVSDASPPQCSAGNSPQGDSEVTIKTEYTELTTADLTLPLQEYVQQNLPVASEDPENLSRNNENIPIETEIKSVVKIEVMEETLEIKQESREISEICDSINISNNHESNADYQFEATNATDTNTTEIETTNFQTMYNLNEINEKPNEINYEEPQKQQNGISEKTDQIAHAMNAAGITTTSETIANNRAHALVNIISQKLRQGSVGPAQSTSVTTSFPKTTSINAMSLQQALAQILPPPLNQTNSSDNNQQTNAQVLHIVQGKNAAGGQITLVDNSQQSVINTSNATPVLHIVQNKPVTSVASSNGTAAPQTNSFSGLSLVDTGLQQGGNQLLHILNTGGQKTGSATSQLLKRVNLLTNLTNVQGSNEQKMVQFVCKSADGKSIQLNGPHQRSMVLRLQPIENPNVTVQTTPPKSAENPDTSPNSNTSTNLHAKDNASQQEIKSRSVYEENYAKFIQNASNKTTEKSTTLPKFNQAFGKPVFQDGSQKPTDVAGNHISASNANSENNECQTTDNNLNLDHIGQIGSPPLLVRKPLTQTSQGQTNLVQQLKQTIAPMNIQTMHGGVIYTRQIPVNIGGGQTINLITVPSTEIMDNSQKQSGNQNEIEQSIIKIIPQNQSTTSSEGNSEDANIPNSSSSDTAPNPQPQPVLTQMRIKLPMLSKNPQMVGGARVVRPSFFQIQRNVIGGANQPVYQQLVLTAAPNLGQQTIRLPQTQTTRQIKVPTENQSSVESQMSSSTLEQLREFDMVLEQVKERSTVQPGSGTNTTFPKLHTPSPDVTDNAVSASTTSNETSQQVLYSIGNNQPLNIAYVNKKSTVTTSSTSSFVRSPDSSGIVDSSNSSSHVQMTHTVTSETTQSETVTQPKPAKVSSKSKSRPKASSNPPSNLKLNTVPPKTSAQKPLEDEQTTQRILYILAEYKEQVENSPDKDKPAPRRRTNPPSNPGSSKRKKSSSGCRRSCRELSPFHEDTCRTMGSEDSSCGTSQGDCNESCMESHSPPNSPRKVVRKLTFEQEIPTPQPRPQPQRNVIVADGQTITVARGTAGKPTTAVLMPANYILPVSMVKGGQQIAIVTNRGPKILTVGGGEGGTTNALLLQRLIGPAGLKPVLARPGVRHVRLPTAALHNLQAFNLAAATSVQPPDSTASPAPAPTPPELIDTRATSSPWTDRESQDVKPERGSSPEGSEPWHLPSSGDPHDYSYEETVRADNLDRTVLDPIPDRYSPDLEAQRIFDKMFDVESKKSYLGDSHDDSPRCAYDIDASDCDDKAYHQVVQKKDGSSHRQHRLTHVSAAALRHKYAILEHELRLQKSLSEECEDLGVDSPSASELFPEAELLFASSPAPDHSQDHQGHHSHTPQPTLLSQSGIPQPDLDDQIATDQLLTADDTDDRQDLTLGLEDVGMVTVDTEIQPASALDHEEFARSHPNTTFHSEPTEEGEVQPFTITGLKGRHITSTIFQSSRAPATVLMTAPSSASGSQPKYHIDNMIDLPTTNANINLASVLVKDDGLTRFDNILTDTRELHLSNTASAIVHSAGNATQVIRRVCYDDDKRNRFLMDEPETLIAGDDAKMIAEDSSRDATMESIVEDVDDDRSSPERHAELFWESNSASERSESRRPLDFSSDSEKCCKSPSFDETNSTDSSGVGTHMRLDSVIKEARGLDRSGSGDGSSADDTHPPLRTYPAKRFNLDVERSLTGKTRAGHIPDGLAPERRLAFGASPESPGRRRTGRGVVKRGCHCCNGSPPRPKKPRQRKPTMDFATN